MHGEQFETRGCQIQYRQSLLISTTNMFACAFAAGTPVPPARLRNQRLHELLSINRPSTETQQTRYRARPERNVVVRALYRPEHASEFATVDLNDVGTEQDFRVDTSRVQHDPEENLRGFVKTRGSLIPGEEFVFWWTGDIYGLVEDQPNKHLFAFEGYNVGRMVRVDGGWRMLTREVGIYRDPTTRKILHETWHNPYTDVNNDVVHIWNDPVNQQFLSRNPRAQSKNSSFMVPTTSCGDDLYWHAEISLCYPSPLPASQFPARSSSDMYHSLEMFQFFCKKTDLSSPNSSADCQISWVRVGQWLPWMEMGDRPGRMIYHCRGKKLENGYQDLSPSLRAYVESHHPEYMLAPLDYTTPNETSWTYFKKLLAAKGTPRADGTVAKPEEVYERTTSNSSLLVSDEAQQFSASDCEARQFTLEDLATFDGTDVSRPIYISLGGLVFDVSSAKRHYRPGETYNCLTGRDATYSFLSGDLSIEGLQVGNPGRGDKLSDAQQKDLDHWIEFFARSYPKVGRLVVDY